MHLQQRPRSAKSVEDMLVVVDPRRISAMSTTSGCSDCTTATLQGARSFGSSYFEDETAATPRLMLESDDDTSLSSNEDDFSSNHSQVQLQSNFIQLFIGAMVSIHSGPENLKKSRQKNSWNQKIISWNCIFGSFKLFPSSKIDFWPFLKLQKMEFGQKKIFLWTYLISRVFLAWHAV